MVWALLQYTALNKDMSIDLVFYYISVYVPPLLFAITLHEAAHAYAAKYFGDNTAYLLGRVSLNPVRHIDPIGTLLLPAALIMLGAPFVLGWAKPVPVAFARLRNPKKEMVYVALAGPAANLLMIFVWAFVLKGLLGFEVESEVLVRMALYGVQINIVLMLFNLLPIPPLDGGRVLVGVLPLHAASSVSRLEPYGMFIVIALFAMGALNYLLLTGVSTVMSTVLSVMGIV